MHEQTRDTGQPHTIADEWGYNPSAWSQRLPIVGLGFVGMCIAFYLTSYQFGFVTNVWDPFFGNGTERVLDSRVSHLFPVSDALLGALGYAADWVFGLVGGTKRYRDKPWAVIVFGIAIVPFGGTSIALGLIMPTIVGSWCTLCLVNTIIGIILIPMSWDEIYLSYLAMRRLRGKGFGWWDIVSGSAAKMEDAHA